MIDAFRNKHPKAKEYTRTDKPTGSKSRLDYIFVSQSVENHFEADDVKIIKDIKNVIEEQTWKFKGVFDHEMVMLSLQLGGPPIGPQTVKEEMSLQLPPIGTDTVKGEIECEPDEGIKPHGHVTLNFKPGMDIQEISLCDEDDLNTVMDNQKDCSNINGKPSVNEPVQTLRNVIQENQSLEDKGTKIKSHLDIFVSEVIENNFEVKDVKIIKVTQKEMKAQTGLSFDGKFDHEMVMLSLQLYGPPIGPQTVKEEIEYESDAEIKPEGGHSVTLSFKPGMDIQEIKHLLESSKLSKYLEKPYTIKAQSCLMFLIYFYGRPFKIGIRCLAGLTCFLLLPTMYLIILLYHML